VATLLRPREDARPVVRPLQVFDQLLQRTPSGSAIGVCFWLRFIDAKRFGSWVSCAPASFGQHAEPWQTTCFGKKLVIGSACATLFGLVKSWF
jgi:hypothetical protein